MKEDVWMKRVVGLLMTTIMILGLCACGNKEEGLTLGEAVSTDLVEFQLEDSVFTSYVSNARSTYVEATDAENDLFAAAEGHCYISMVFTITNKSHDRSICYASTFAEWNPGWVVSYKGESYPVKGFDVNNEEGTEFINLSYAAIVDQASGITIKKNESINYLLAPNEKVTIRTFGVIDVEPDTLNDAYNVKVGVLNTEGVHEEFTYAVPERK